MFNYIAHSLGVGNPCLTIVYTHWRVGNPCLAILYAM